MKEAKLPVGLRVTYPHRSLRRWLYKHGYVLCHADKYVEMNRRWHDIKNADRRKWDTEAAIWPLHERIMELEAEVEAHKRVEAKLAERVVS